MAFRLGSRRQKLGPRATLLVGGFVCLMALFVVGLGCLVPLYRQSAAASWVETPCTIVSSEIRRSTHKGRARFQPLVTFRYEVDGVAHTSDEYALTDVRSSDATRAQAVVARFSPGDRATCYVDPRDPDQAVIVREIEDVWMPLGIGSVLFCIGVFVVLRRLRGNALEPSRPQV